jgi:hypothetical protein
MQERLKWNVRALNADKMVLCNEIGLRHHEAHGLAVCRGL